MKILQALAIVSLLFGSSACAAAPTKNGPRGQNRVASILISEDFLNEVFADHLKNEIVSDVKISFDTDQGRIFFRGIAKVPLEEMRAVNLSAEMSTFRFQVGVKPSVTTEGHLRLEFPIDETYFYPANSKNPKRDRVIVPVQMLSIALASARGYLSALSGDFSGFDRREAKMKALAKNLDRSISAEKNPDALEELKNQREELRLKLEAVPLERKQLQAMGKQVEKILGFSGEKDMNLNEELGAAKNAIVLKVRLSQIVPYLKGVDLGGVRLLHDTKDGPAQNVLAIDVNSTVDILQARTTRGPQVQREPSKYTSSIILRLNQRLFETETVKSAEQGMSSKIRELKFDFKDDGLHVSGGFKVLLLVVPFDTTIDFSAIEPDLFEVRVRSLDIAGLDLDYLKKVALEAIQNRLDQAFPGACRFEMKEEKTERILRVAVDPKVLLPAFPNLHLVDVDVRDRFFLMKVGKIGK